MIATGQVIDLEDVFVRCLGHCDNHTVTTSHRYTVYVRSASLTMGHAVWGGGGGGAVVEKPQIMGFLGAWRKTR